MLSLVSIVGYVVGYVASRMTIRFKNDIINRHRSDFRGGQKRVYTSFKFRKDTRYKGLYSRSTKISIWGHGIKIKDNAREIVEQERVKKRSELLAQEEMARKKDPSRYGGMLRGPEVV